MEDARSILKASGVDDLFAKMEEECRVPCAITLEGMAVRLWMLSLLSLPPEKRHGDKRPDRGTGRSATERRTVGRRSGCNLRVVSNG